MDIIYIYMYGSYHGSGQHQPSHLFRLAMAEVDDMESEEEEEEDSETWIKMEGKPTVKSTKFEEEIIGLVGNLKPERVCEMMGQRWTKHGFW